MKCPHCGNLNPDGAKACVLCGQMLSPDFGAYQQNPQAASSQGYRAGDAIGVSFPPPNRSFSPDANTTKKYKALRLIAVIYKVLAFVVSGLYLLMAVVSLFFAMAGASSARREFGELGAVFGLYGIFGTIFWLFSAAFAFLFFYAIAEAIYVVIDIEENTRVTNKLLLDRLRG